MWRKPGPSGVIRSMLQPGMGQSSFMPRPMGLRPPSPNTSDHHHDPRKARESQPGQAQSYAAGSYGVTITLDEARRHRTAWFDAYPAFRRWHIKSKALAEKSL